jgi:hypothetical protein
MAIEKNDYSAKTLKKYIDFLDSTSLWRTMYESGKREGYQRVFADIMEKSQRRYYDFTIREPYPFWKAIYLRIGRDSTPLVLRWLMTGCVHLSSFCSSLYDRMRRKFKSRYHDWKKGCSPSAQFGPDPTS